MVFDKYDHLWRTLLEKKWQKNHLKCKINNTMKYLREADRVSEFDQKDEKRVKTVIFDQNLKVIGTRNSLWNFPLKG